MIWAGASRSVPFQSMPLILVASETITVGKTVVIEGRSPSHPFGIVFEDDGSTAYLYGLDYGRQDNPIVDARHIYVADVSDREKPSVVQLVWSQDGLKSALLINTYPHAVFDFESCRSYCRTGFPPRATSGWERGGHDWSDAVQALFQ